MQPKQQVKGGVLKSRLQFVEDTAGKDAVQRVLAVLGDDDRLVPPPSVPELVVRASTSAPANDRIIVSP